MVKVIGAFLLAFVLAFAIGAELANASHTRCNGDPVRHRFLGSQRNDFIVGNHRNNVMAGRGGEDILFGGGNRDQVCGGPGGDTLRGESGGDFLNGGPGTRDRHYCGRGNDTALVSSNFEFNFAIEHSCEAILLATR
jgi:Ca2+-binding RTX toxin-like protein